MTTKFQFIPSSWQIRTVKVLSESDKYYTVQVEDFSIDKKKMSSKIRIGKGHPNLFDTFEQAKARALFIAEEHVKDQQEELEHAKKFLKAVKNWKMPQ